MKNSQAKKLRDNTLRLELGNRGGGIEIDLTKYGYKDEKMTAYQNYLGGGMVGRIANDCTVDNWRTDSKLVELANDLAHHYFNLSNGLSNDDSELYDDEFNAMQTRSVRAY